jgi:hypothetical protein
MGDQHQDLLNEIAKKLGFVYQSGHEEVYTVGDRRFRVSKDIFLPSKISKVLVYDSKVKLELWDEGFHASFVSGRFYRFVESDTFYAEALKDALLMINPEGEPEPYWGLVWFLEEKERVAREAALSVKRDRAREELAERLEQTLELLPLEEVEEIFKVQVTKSVHKS